MKTSALYIRYTTAPEAYDGFGTKSRGVVAMDNDKPVRMVEINPEHLNWQEGRYGSGMHCSCTLHDYLQFCDAGIFRKV